MTIKLPNYQCTLLALITALLCFTASVSYNGFKTVEKQQKINTEYSRLRSGILYTNLRIRDAALISTRVSLDDELAKINPVRKESLDALDFFRREQHTFPLEQRLITQRILIDRMEYRAVQNKLLSLLRDTDFERDRYDDYVKDRWRLLQQYNLLMVEYIDKCDALISLGNVTMKRTQEQAVLRSILATGLAILMIAGLLLSEWFSNK